MEQNNMNRAEVYEALTELIPDLQRRCATPRVLSESGVDALLDRLIEINYEPLEIEL